MGVGSEPVPLQRGHGAGWPPVSASFRFPLPPHAEQRGRGGMRRMTRGSSWLAKRSLSQAGCFSTRSRVSSLLAGAAMSAPRSPIEDAYPHDGVITHPRRGRGSGLELEAKTDGQSTIDETLRVRCAEGLPGRPVVDELKPAWIPTLQTSSAHEVEASPDRIRTCDLRFRSFAVGLVDLRGSHSNAWRTRRLRIVG